MFTGENVAANSSMAAELEFLATEKATEMLDEMTAADHIREISEIADLGDGLSNDDWISLMRLVGRTI